MMNLLLISALLLGTGYTYAALARAARRQPVLLERVSSRRK
jgi:hypothetical protein